MNTLSSPDLCALTGATYRQIDYWARNGVLVPSRPARGSGSQRLYTLHEARVARVLVVLSAHGARYNVLGPAAGALCVDGPLWGGPLWGGPVVVTAAGAVVTPSEAPPAGWLLDLAAIRLQVDARVGCLAGAA